ncbi:MAG: helix-turn-helix transcriptional regulator [Lachnospiraceae bacterium]|nr:helix-turn-helix transcriptional regulator [Lachnospiraceae bacterium]
MDRAELGKIIKDARLAKKMTQSEVVGNFITRNMLSQIESGVAVPSIKTLEYLSKKLDISIQMLSAGQNAESRSVIPTDYEIIRNAKARFRSGKYEEAARIIKPCLSESNEFFDEACAIYTMSTLACAGKAELDKETACNYAREALLYSEKGFYACREWKVEAICLIEKLS